MLNRNTSHCKKFIDNSRNNDNNPFQSLISVKKLNVSNISVRGVLFILGKGLQKKPYKPQKKYIYMHFFLIHTSRTKISEVGLKPDSPPPWKNLL